MHKVYIYENQVKFDQNNIESSERDAGINPEF